MIHIHYLFNNLHPDGLLIYFPQDFLYKKNSMKFIKQKIDRLFFIFLLNLLFKLKGKAYIQ